MKVDGFTLINLEEKEIFSMLPGKIEPARKIITLLKQMKDLNRTCHSKISSTSEQVCTFKDSNKLSNFESRTIHFLSI